MSALAEIVGARVHDNGPAQNTLGSDQFDEVVGDRALGVALAVSLEVAEIADVAVVVGGRAMFFGVGVDWVREVLAGLVSSRDEQGFERTFEGQALGKREVQTGGNCRR